MNDTSSNLILLIVLGLLMQKSNRPVFLKIGGCFLQQKAKLFLGPTAGGDTSFYILILK